MSELSVGTGSSPGKVTVLLARREVEVAVADILRDWAALGVVDEVFTIAVEDVSDLNLAARQIGPGGSRRVRLTDELASRYDVDLLRIGVLDLPRLAPHVAEGEAAAVRTAITQVLPSVRAVAVHLLAPQFDADAGTTGRAELGWRREATAWSGWHNVVIAPENSAAPSAGVAPVLAADDDPVSLTHPVAACCGLLGVLRAHTDSVFDDEPYLPGEQVYVARTFTRFVTAEAITHEVLARATDVADRYPVPQVGGRQVLVVDDELEASLEMARRLLSVHAAVLPSQRVPPERTPPRRIGAGEALGMFFSFFFAALRNAPKTFLRMMVRKTQAALAREVGSFVFGPGDSAYQVVVGGIGADGRPVPPDILDSALDHLQNQTGQAYRPEQLGALWRDYVDGGLTLLDAGQRSSELRYVQVGNSRAVVSTTARVAPAPGTGFRLSDDLAAYLPGWEIDGLDLARARQLDAQLAVLPREHGQLTEAVAQQRRALADWVHSVDGYSGHVAARLGHGLLDTIAEIETLNSELRAQRAEVALPPDTEDRQRRLARALVGTAAATGVLGIVTILLTWKGPLDWWMGLLICLLLGSGWLAISLRFFMRHQQEIFAILHRHEDEARRGLVLTEHLRSAIGDARRLNRAYRQFLDWSRALSAFIHAPLGAPPAHQQRDVLVGPGLPRNVMIGVADATPATLADAVEGVRRELFDVSWLSECFEQFITDLPSGLGSWQFQVREQPDVLWSDPRIDATGSVLSAWSRAVSEHATERAVPAGFVARLGELLAQDRTGRRLREQVRIRASATGDLQTLSYQNFMAGLEDDQPGGVFDSRLFAPALDQVDAARVRRSMARPAKEGVAVSMVLTQLSGGLQAEDLRTLEAETTARPVAGFDPLEQLPPV